MKKLFYIQILVLVAFVAIIVFGHIRSNDPMRYDGPKCPPGFIPVEYGCLPMPPQDVQNGTYPSIREVTINSQIFDGHSVTLEGYVLGIDIESEIINNKTHLNLRDNASMTNNHNISMGIDSRDIRQSLIDKYGQTKDNWIKVKVSGIVELAEAGMTQKIPTINVSSLTIE